MDTTMTEILEGVIEIVKQAINVFHKYPATVAVFSFVVLIFTAMAGITPLMYASLICLLVSYFIHITKKNKKKKAKAK